MYKATGNLRVVQILLVHSGIKNTIRYLSVDVDGALTLSERKEIRSLGSSLGGGRSHLEPY